MAVKRYLGLDLSLTSPGLAVAEIRRGKINLVHLDTLKTSNKWDEGQRFDHVAAWLACKFYEWGPFEAVAREMAVGSFNAHINRSLFGVRAMSAHVLRGTGTKFADYTPSSVKKEIGGSGKAGKDAVEAGVLRYFPDTEFRGDDESDAVAVVLTYLIREGVINRLSEK
ncbi:crossover junction endodeoxyribonuclease RuvC [Paludifilum halophilum]|nr:crossover junction endodeoxyribonuclease RuvC [Paludifilum halophilum]